MVHPMNVHIHTINKQSPNLDLQYGCTQEKKQRALDQEPHDESQTGNAAQDSDSDQLRADGTQDKKR